MQAFICGTAGSGKTLFTGVLRRYLKTQDINVVCVNLDPAVRFIPYPVDVDVREYINFDQIVEDYSLGPNGGMIATVDLLVDRFLEIKEEIEDFNADAVLFDTPGQLEIFVYREAGPIIVSQFPSDETACLFLYDGSICSNPASWVSINLLATSVQFQLKLPMVSILSKSDLLSENQIEKLYRWNEDCDLLIDDLFSTTPAIGALTTKIVEALKEFQSNTPLLMVSALKEEGIKNVAAFLSQIWRHGDDWLI